MQRPTSAARSRQFQRKIHSFCGRRTGRASLEFFFSMGSPAGRPWTANIPRTFTSQRDSFPYFLFFLYSSRADAFLSACDQCLCNLNGIKEVHSPIICKNAALPSKFVVDFDSQPSHISSYVSIGLVIISPNWESVNKIHWVLMINAAIISITIC